MINVQGPDGSNISFPNGTPEAEITAALDSHFGAPKNVSRETTGQAPAADASDTPSIPSGMVRAVGTGMPGGGLLNKLDAATNALLAPALDKYLPENFKRLPEGSFAERYQHGLDLQNRMDKSFSEAHPVLQTGSEIAGGLGATGAFLKTAPKIAPRALGLTGETLPQQALQGAAAGAALGAADSATRGQDIGTGAMVGAGTGAAAPAVARGIGKLISSARGTLAPPTAPENFMNVNGVKVPVTQGTMTGDPGMIQVEQGMLRGSDNPKAMTLAQDFVNNRQKPAIAQAAEATARGMSPTGDLVASNPQEGASHVLDSLQQRGQQQATATGDVQGQITAMRQAEQQSAQQASQRIEQQSQALMESFGGGSTEPPWYHGTGGALGPLRADKPMYLTTSQDDAMGFARQQHLGGSAGEPNVHAFATRPGRSLNIDDEIMQAMDSDADINSTIESGIRRAKTSGARYVEFSHPSFSGGDDIPVRVSLYPHEDLTTHRPASGVLATSPSEAGQVLQDSISQARSNAQGAYRQAYDALGNAQGKFHPASFNGVGNRIAQAVTTPGSEIPEITKETTPIAARALGALEDVTSGLTQQRVNGRIQPMQPITGEVVDNARKRLNSFVRVAKSTGQATGNWADYAATRAVVEQFDTEVRDAIGSGKYMGGDGQALLRSMDDARGLYSKFRKTFTRQGAGDRVGPMMENIVGRFEGQEAPTEQVGQMLTRGNNAPLLGNRIVQIFGQGSPEVGAAKQGIFSSLTRDATGAPMPSAKQAGNIEGFLRNNSLSKVYMTDAERAALASHAADLRRSARGSLFESLHGSDSAATASKIGDYLQAPDRSVHSPQDLQNLAKYANLHQQYADMTANPKTAAGKMMGSLKGLSASEPTETTITNLLKQGGTERPVGFVKSVIQEFGQNSTQHVAVKQGVWAHLLENRTGPLDTGSKAVISKLDDFLNKNGKPLADVLYSPEEREGMQNYLDLMKKITPANGVVNYSNTGMVNARLARGVVDALVGGGMMGLDAGLTGGVVGGFVADRVTQNVRNLLGAAKAARLYYGTPQALQATANLQRELGMWAGIAQRGTLPAMH